MTVAELIQELMKLSQDKIVVVSSPNVDSPECFSKIWPLEDEVNVVICCDF